MKRKDTVNTKIIANSLTERVSLKTRTSKTRNTSLPCAPCTLIMVFAHMEEDVFLGMTKGAYMKYCRDIFTEEY